MLAIVLISRLPLSQVLQSFIIYAYTHYSIIVFLAFFCLWFTFFFFFFLRRHSADTSSACLLYSLMPYSLLILLLLSLTDDITSTFNFLLIPTSPLTRTTVYVFHILTIFYVLNIALFSWGQSIKMGLEFQLWHVNSLEVLRAQGKS